MTARQAARHTEQTKLALRQGSAAWLLASAAGLAIGCVPGQARAAASLRNLAPVMGCESLGRSDIAALTGTPGHLTAARSIPGPGGGVCRVSGTFLPSIQFEVDLPLKAWSQRTLQTGCGGLCGVLDIHMSHTAGCRPAEAGTLVVASDDMGHQSMAPDFGADPQKRIDFAYRGNHVTALAVQALATRFYGQAPKYRYFSGCSDGGREALVEAERYPGDFDGIAAGAPAMNFQVQNSFYHAWQALANTGPDGKPVLVADRLAILHQAVLAQCDTLDGDKDGLIADPRACHFDPAVAQCKPGAANTQSCLTAEEVAAARELYAGPTDAVGTHFTIGGPQPGSELAWAGVFVPPSKAAPIFSAMIASGSLQFVHFPQVSPADGDLSHFSFTQANFDRLAALHPLYDATDTNLAPFAARGGKLLLWHGWSDPHISPINTIAYYHGLGAVLGTKLRDTARLFLFPGMYHCGGGDGFSQFDVLTPLMDWVEHGRAPDSILAEQVASRPMGPPPRLGGPLAQRPAPMPEPNEPVLATRPVYAYPGQARFSGTGDIKAAANWRVGAPLVDDPQRYDWAGARFMSAGFLRWYGVSGGALAQGAPPAR